MNEPHKYKCHIHYHHTDAGGVVYYGRYMELAEEARGAALREMWAEYPLPGADFMVRNLSAEYLASAVLNDDLTVETLFKNPKGATVEASQRVMRGEEVLVVINTLIAYVSDVSGGRKPVRIPEEMRRKL